MTLKLIKCHLLDLLDFDYYSLHETLEISHQKLTLIDEYVITNFLANYRHLMCPEESRRNELMKVFEYQQKLS